MQEQHPSLFGLNNCNRDFLMKESWGKNQFNSSFPVALCCYLHHKGFLANYLKIKNGVLAHEGLSIVFNSPELFE
ncbi:HindVP family restriction endonuclease [Spirulina sp. CCNP1310]|uniref:HindVP family restriction endonuclease n=1 Tax=Spirulina sp. CCNP1310 TaxID=3110249 RepID=UPI002B213505|nr:HindVP family restriction endonuclease [Spirulina sp. CCNP1310]MEA5421168.1 HindVP family restriction endonuclease [Spirulina sp. CCNP1310]